MAGYAPPQPIPTDAVIITVNGQRYLFPDRAAAREFLMQPMTAEESDRARRALARLDDLRQQILAETDGRGISRDDIDDALREARDH